jgi:hypothetical protein
LLGFFAISQTTDSGGASGFLFFRRAASRFFAAAANHLAKVRALSGIPVYAKTVACVRDRYSCGLSAGGLVSARDNTAVFERATPHVVPCFRA